MQVKTLRSKVSNGPWQCSSPDRIDNVRARSKVGNVPVAMFLSVRGNVPAVRRFSDELCETDEVETLLGTLTAERTDTDELCEADEVETLLGTLTAEKTVLDERCKTDIEVGTLLGIVTAERTGLDEHCEADEVKLKHTLEAETVQVVDGNESCGAIFAINKLKISLLGRVQCSCLASAGSKYVTVYGKTGHNAACVISRKDRSIS